jgi:hypothetical protein
MKIIKIIFLFLATFVYSQRRIEYYNNGYDGIECVSKVRGSDSMVVYSNYRARPLIRREVCDSILKKYRYLKNGPYIIFIKDAKIFGRLEIVRKDNLVSIKYFYERVIYSNGLTEIYKKSKKRVNKK